MGALPLALILIIVVSCVMVATVPDTSRRTPRRAAGRISRGGSGRAGSTGRRGVAVQRNRWDRPDLDRAIGRFDDEGDSTLSVWPGGA